MQGVNLSTGATVATAAAVTIALAAVTTAIGLSGLALASNPQPTFSVTTGRVTAAAIASASPQPSPVPTTLLPSRYAVFTYPQLVDAVGARLDPIQADTSIEDELMRLVGLAQRGSKIRIAMYTWTRRTIADEL